MKQAIIEVVNFKMIHHPVKIRAEFKLTMYTLGGVTDIKAALREGQSLSTKDIPIEIRLIASPTYEVTSNTIKKNEGIALIVDAIKKIEQAVKVRLGNFILISKVRIVIN